MKNLREKYLKLKEEEEEKKKRRGGKSDKRFLNYFDLGDDQTMTVRFLPDASGEDIFVSYSEHGKELWDKGVKERISCASTSMGEKCPACSYSYQLYQSGDKDGAKDWRRKESFLSQVLVIESPIEINQSEDGNIVKLFNMPFAIKEIIVESILNQIIDDPTAHDFVIKKTKNKGGFAEYGKSFFKPKTTDLPANVEAMLDKVTLFNLSELVPAPASAAQVQEWLSAAQQIVDKKETNGTLATPASTTQQEEAKKEEKPKQQEEVKAQEPAKKPSSAADLLARLNSRR